MDRCEDVEKGARATGAAGVGGDPLGGTPTPGRAENAVDPPKDNMGVASSHCGIMNTPIGEDTAVITGRVDWGDCASDLYKLLQNKQMDARKKRNCKDDIRAHGTNGENLEGREKPGNGYLSEPANNCSASSQLGNADAIIDIGGFPWSVWPSGQGGGRRGLFFPFVATYGAINIAFRQSDNDKIPNVKVEIGSIPLVQLGGLKNAWDWVKERIKDLNGTVISHILSRVDYYTDVSNVHIGEFQGRFRDGKIITRSRKKGEYTTGNEAGNDETEYHFAAMYRCGRIDSGFAIGGKNLMLRVYDKRLEMQYSKLKEAVFAERYGGELPEIMTRVEYQLRRDTIRTMEIGGCRVDAVEDSDKYKNDIWKYLTGRWFRMTDDIVDHKNKHQKRAKVWSVWKAINEMSGGIIDVGRVPRPSRVNCNQLMNQGLSCILKAGVYRGEISNLHDVMPYIIRTVPGMQIDEKVTKYQEEYDTLCGTYN